MSNVVLDASALLAALQGEPGEQRVVQAIETGAMISAVNLSEVVAKLSNDGLSDAEVREALAAVQVEIEPFEEQSAYDAGFLRVRTKSFGLSLGDRSALALALRLKCPLLTTDRARANLGIGVDVRVIR